MSDKSNETLIALLSDILEQIGTTANALGDTLDYMVCEGNKEVVSQTYLLSRVADQIGYLADLGITHISGSPEIVGDAEDWMLPPRYHELRKSSKEVGA